MSDNVTMLQGASLGAGVSTGIITTVTNNATFITVMTTVCFGLIYASCAIWNAYSNHKRNKVNKRNIVEAILDDIEADDDIEPHVVDIIKAKIRK